MYDDFGSDFITISDEEGHEYTLEHLDTMEFDGEFYLAFLPADMDERDEHYGMLILKKEVDKGEEFLVVPDDEELETVYEKFMERLYADEYNDEAEDDPYKSDDEPEQDHDEYLKEQN